jgi:hypothetical protein
MPFYVQTVSSVSALKMQVAEVLSVDVILCQNSSLCKHSKDVPREKFEISEM